MVYFIHGVAAIAAVTLVMIHVHFALIPENRPYLLAMIRGWMTRDEYLLAYAAQGRQDAAGTEVRQTLKDMQAAQAAAAFIDAVFEDASKAQGAIALVLSRGAIGSLLVDNLNASIHLRALLTDVFLADQALRRE
jgi:hypothetical protein